jgi:hypothetical protein
MAENDQDFNPNYIPDDYSPAFEILDIQEPEKLD